MSDMDVLGSADVGMGNGMYFSPKKHGSKPGCDESYTLNFFRNRLFSGFSSSSRTTCTVTRFVFFTDVLFASSLIATVSPGR